jgi:unsaturated chondroitin disaccharide hydrolase
MNQKKWVKESLDKIYEKTLNSIQKHGVNFIPYQATNGNYIDDMSKKDIVWWTNGFWSGWNWQINNYKNNSALVEAAKENEKDLDNAFLKYQGLHHDVGFMWLPTAVADFQINNDQLSYWRGRHAADLLAGRYNPVGKYLRSWNKDRAGWVIIDSMLNIQLLYWASKVTNDPRFRMMADNHAHTVMNNHVRADGSVSHIVVFDPNTGEKVGTKTGQGYSENSCWSRGQSWAIYGFAAAYDKTNNMEYLNTAKRAANYFLANVSQTDYIPNIDFKAPLENHGVDTSAASIAACGLLEIAKFCSDSEKSLYFNSALKILHSLDEKYADYDPNKDGILVGATTAYHDENGWNVNLNYGDYFFIEALLRILDNNLYIF